jgi:YD repeat-containing protein
MNRKSAVINGNGQRTETQYDLSGHTVNVTNANGEITKTVYDAVGRLTSITNPLGYQTQYKYDANGNQTCVIDANGLSLVTDPGHQPLNIDGCTESRSYDELNRVTQTKDAQNNITAYTYNFYGNRTTLTDAAGRITTFKYDDLGRMTEIVDPLIETPTDKTQLFAYDEAGNLIQATDRKGLVMQYTYDILNRNTQTLHLFDNSTESTIYDSFGDLIQSQNSAIGYTYTYTSKHQLKSKTDSRLNKSLTWSWDPVGNIQTKPTIKAISPPTNTTVPTVWWPNPTRLIWKSVIITMVQDAWRIAFSATAPIPVMFGTLADV